MRESEIIKDKGIKNALCIMLTPQLIHCQNNKLISTTPKYHCQGVSQIITQEKPKQFRD